jgi:hypothetical protein
VTLNRETLKMANGGFELLDFVGYPTGAGTPFSPPIPPCGFLGIIDWTGLPCGAGAPVLPPLIVKGHGFRGAGRHIPYILRMAQMMRVNAKRNQLVTRSAQHISYTKRVLEEGWQAEAAYRKKLTESQMYSVLLAEI